MSPLSEACELRPAEVGRARGLGEIAGTVLAFAGLVGVDLLVRRQGFPALYRRLRAWPVRRGDRPLEPARARSVCAAVDRAAVYYFRRAWCLQRSAATTFLLRWRGFPAEMVIGVRRAPFAAHAWVELDGEVINDHPAVRSSYLPIERLAPPGAGLP